MQQTLPAVMPDFSTISARGLLGGPSVSGASHHLLSEAEIISLLTKKQTAAMVGLHPESLMRLVREGRFPRPLKISDAKNSRVMFDQQDVKAWIETRKAAALLK